MYKVLFTLGDWTIRRMDRDTQSDLKYHACHICDGVAEESLSWFVCDDHDKCYGCDEPVPEEIQALLIMLVGGV